MRSPFPPAAVRLLGVSVAAALAAAAIITDRDITAASPFAPGDLAVYRVGTGTGSLVNTGNPVFVDEYTTAGTLVQSFTLPTSASGANHRLVASGTATSEGFLTRSADGHFLLMTGYDAPTPTTGLAGTAATSVPRVVGRVDAFGNIDTTTALTDFAGGNNPRSATSTNGVDLWVGGAAGSVRYAALGATTSTALTALANIRNVAIFGGQLYGSTTAGSSPRLFTVGSGLPTTGAANATTNLPGFPTGSTSNPFAYFFADLDGTAGLDTLYVADDGSSAPGGITKYSLVSGTWTSNGTVGTASDAYRGLTGVVAGTTVTLYGTRKGGSGATGGGELVKLVDAAGFNAAMSGTPSLLATAVANTAFRGVALAPTPAPATVILSVSTATASEAAQTQVTITANSSAPVAGAQTVDVAVSGAGITGGDYSLSGTTITIPHGQTSGSVTFTVTDDALVEGPEVATITLVNASAGITLGSPVSRTITIIDNDYPAPGANADGYVVEAGTTLTVPANTGVLANDTGGALAVFSHSTPAHGALTMNADGSFTYTPAAGYTGSDSFDYTVMNASPVYNLQLFKTNVAPLATIGGVTITGGGFGSAIARVPGSPDEIYGLTDRGPNVDGPNGTKVEPLPDFTPAIAKFKLSGGQAILEATIPLLASDNTPYSGRVSTLADTGETILDLNGNTLAKDPNGYDSEGLVAMADGTFWVSDEYGPFITHFDATGHALQRLSPFDGSLPAELALRIVNRGMEGLTITPDGSTLVGIMQSALQQADLNGFDAKKLTPLRIVTYRLTDGALHEYVYLLDNPSQTKTAVSEITALSSTQFLVDERDGNFPPGAYKKIFLVDLSGATDVGPLANVAGALYDAANGGLRVGGSTLEKLLLSGSTALDTPTSASTLLTQGITTVSKTLDVDLGALLDAADPLGRFFGHDKIEGLVASNGGATLIVSNDSDFGIDGLSNSAPPFQLHAKLTSAGVQDDGEFLMVDLRRSSATVTISVVDTTPPDTTITATPSNPNNSSSAGFVFTGTDSGSGVAGFECAIDNGAFTTCASGVTFTGLADGGHSFGVRAVDRSANADQSPATYSWTIDTTPPTITSISASPASLWPPNGKMISATMAVSATDSLDPAPACRITNIVSNDGTAADQQVTGALTLLLRAERAGNVADRIYTITVQCSDALGNLRTTTTAVIVPHDQGKK